MIPWGDAVYCLLHVQLSGIVKTPAGPAVKFTDDSIAVLPSGVRHELDNEGRLILYPACVKSLDKYWGRNLWVNSSRKVAVLQHMRNVSELDRLWREMVQEEWPSRVPCGIFRSIWDRVNKDNPEWY